MIKATVARDRIVILPQSITTTEVTGSLDTFGPTGQKFDYAIIRLIADTAAASSVLTTFSLAEGEVANVSSATALATFELGDTTNCEAIVAPNTSTGDVVRYCVDLRGRMRYLNVGLGSTTARLCAVVAELLRADEMPNTDTEKGVTQEVIG